MTESKLEQIKNLLNNTILLKWVHTFKMGKKVFSR